MEEQEKPNREEVGYPLHSIKTNERSKEEEQKKKKMK
jgi:hypothetical protein